jgi:hypothetical protein
MLEVHGWITAVGAKKGGKSRATQYVISVAKINAAHETQRLAASNPTAPVAFKSPNPTAPDPNPTAPVAEHRSNREIKTTENLKLRSEATPKPKLALKSKPKDNVLGKVIRNPGYPGWEKRLHHFCGSYEKFILSEIQRGPQQAGSPGDKNAA